MRSSTSRTSFDLHCLTSPSLLWKWGQLARPRPTSTEYVMLFVTSPDLHLPGHTSLPPVSMRSSTRLITHDLHQLRGHKRDSQYTWATLDPTCPDFLYLPPPQMSSLNQASKMLLPAAVLSLKDISHSSIVWNYKCVAQLVQRQVVIWHTHTHTWSWKEKRYVSKGNKCW